MKILAIDPGKTGALAFGDMESVHEMVVMPEDIAETIRIIKEHEPTICWLESSQSMPKQGISSAFKYGKHFGELIGALRALMIPIRMIKPTVWTKVVHKGYSGKDAKEKSKQAAYNLYPHLNFVATERSRKGHDGLIDCICIFEYAKREMSVE